MTALGIDISEHNPGLVIPTDGSLNYVIARASLAETKKDSLYRTFRDQCKTAKIPFAAYHFVYPPLPGSSYAAQASNFHAVVGDTSIPVMLDVETDNTTHPSLADAVGVKRALVALGYRVPLVYLPRWYWSGALGSAPIPTELGDLMSSSYGANTSALLKVGYANRGGDTGSGWTSYGGRPVGIWQFTSNALVGGQSIDGGACKQALSSYFTLWGATGDDMTQADIDAINAHTDAKIAEVMTRLTAVRGDVISVEKAQQDATAAAITATETAVKKTVSDTSAATLAGVSQVAAKVTDVADAVAQLQTGGGAAPGYTGTFTGELTPKTPA